MSVKQVGHCLDLIELFARDRAPKTLTQVAVQLGVPKSSTFNLLRTLLVRGYVYEVRQRAGYYPTRRLYDLALDIAEGDPVAARIHSELEALARQTGETVILAARHGDQVVYVDVIESSAPVRYAARAGDHRPVYATSGGKAILSTYEEPQLSELLASFTYVRHRLGTVGDAGALARDLAASRERGWFSNLSEFTPDVTGIGLPLTVAGRRFGLSVAGPKFRMDGRHAEVAAAIGAAVDRIRTVLDRIPETNTAGSA
jgi:IclR family transcriptional regulator, acetate operon repressor